MRVKLLLFTIALFLLSSCTYEQQPINYVIGEPLVFVIEEKNPLAWEQETREDRSKLNKIRALRDYDDKEEEFYYESKLSNVRRIHNNELIIGYVKKYDNPDFKEVE